jgi:hypothetical protein
MKHKRTEGDVWGGGGEGGDIRYILFADINSNVRIKSFIRNYVKLASLMFQLSLVLPSTLQLAMFSAVDVPAVTSVPDVAAPILLMTSNLLLEFLSFLTSPMLLASLLWLASLLLLMF